MKLKKILKILPNALIKGPKNLEISGLCNHSKFITPGDLFIVKKGNVYDGHIYISEAIASGAVAILTDLYDPFIKQIPQVIHPDISSIEGLLAAWFYEDPSHKLKVIGITGTNGKTSCTYLLHHLLNALNIPCALTSTVENIIGNHRYPTNCTTSNVTINHKLLHEMHRHACKSVAMEVSSHALVQKRVSHIDFSAAIFTNLSPEHLDYHHNMENYFEAKAQLFKGLNKEKGYAIINGDDPWAKRMIEKTSTRILTYGFGKDNAVKASNLNLSTHGTSFTVTYQDQKEQFSWDLVGKYNILNALSVITYALSIGQTLSSLSSPLSLFKSAPGRLEVVPNELDIAIYVDYAHTPNALENVLSCVHGLSSQRIITIFGCGGDRDKIKRPVMGAIAEKFSDICIITSDNPRTEAPELIIKEILSGIKKPAHCLIELDRRHAIEKALDLAKPGDLILIAGKGHERLQTFAHHTIPFDDIKVAHEISIQKFNNLQRSGSILL